MKWVNNNYHYIRNYICDNIRWQESFTINQPTIERTWVLCWDFSSPISINNCFCEHSKSTKIMNTCPREKYDAVGDKAVIRSVIPESISHCLKGIDLEFSKYNLFNACQQKQRNVNIINEMEKLQRNNDCCQAVWTKWTHSFCKRDNYIVFSFGNMNWVLCSPYYDDIVVILPLEIHNLDVANNYRNLTSKDFQ